MIVNFFDSLYTLQDIAIHNNFESKELSLLTKYSNKQKLSKISDRFPVLRKFLLYCKCYKKDNRYVYAIPAYIYDTYCITGFLPDINQYDTSHDVSKKEYWQYNPFISFDIKPQEGWDFANKLFGENNNLSEDDVWRIFLSGCARMDYYQDEETDLESRIKYAIVEYMLKRPQFFTTDDFIDNPILHKKYSKK